MFSKTIEKVIYLEFGIFPSVIVKKIWIDEKQMLICLKKCYKLIIIFLIFFDIRWYEHNLK